MPGRHVFGGSVGFKQTGHAGWGPMDGMHIGGRDVDDEEEGMGLVGQGQNTPENGDCFWMFSRSRDRSRYYIKREETPALLDSRTTQVQVEKEVTCPISPSPMDAPLHPASLPAPNSFPAVPNGVAVVVNGIHDPEHAVNGVFDDPTTPISNAVASELKIDIDLPEQESDARHEPLPHIQHPPEHGTLLVGSGFDFASSCVRAAHASNGVNGTNGDASMHDVDVHSPATTPGGVPPGSSNGASTSHTSPADPHPVDQEDDQPPPAKRPRILSDADKASFTHVSLVFLCTPQRAC